MCKEIDELRDVDRIEKHVVVSANRLNMLEWLAELAARQECTRQDNHGLSFIKNPCIHCQAVMFFKNYPDKGK